MTLVRFQPARSGALLPDFWTLPFTGTATTQPVVNILETSDGFRLELAAPGLAKEDFQIKVEKDLLTISAQKETNLAEEGATFHRREFSYGTFERSFRLSGNIDTDKVQANFDNGILKVTLVKKAKTEPEAKTIAIS